jgi:hypothetical protein
MRKYNPAIHKNLRRATTRLKDGHRLETAVDISDNNVQVFVLDRREVLSLEDGYSLSVGKDKLPPVSNIRRY